MKTIYHVGAWNRNYGDWALQAGLQLKLQEVSPHPLRFIPVDCQKTFFHPDLIEYINRQGDMLLVGGGGLVFHRPGDQSLSGWQFNIRLEDLKRLEVPLVVYAIGYNKFFYDDRGFKPVMNDHLAATQNQAALFSVRNQGTREELLLRGLDPERLPVIPDPGMFAPAAPLAIRDLDPGQFKVGLNWAGDRNHYRFPPPWEEARLRFIDDLCKALNALLDRLGGGTVISIPHLSQIDSELDSLFAERLGGRFYELETRMPYIYPPSQAQLPLWAGIYAAMDLVVGMRGHANIVPFGLNVPFLGMGSHNKNRFFLAEVGEPELMLEAADYPAGGSVEVMLEKMNRAVDDTDLKERLAARLKEFTAVADDFNRRVVELL